MRRKLGAPGKAIGLNGKSDLEWGKASRGILESKGGTSRPWGSPRAKVSCQMSSQEQVCLSTPALLCHLWEQLIRITTSAQTLPQTWELSSCNHQLVMLPGVRGLGRIFSWLPHLANVNSYYLKEYLSRSGWWWSPPNRFLLISAQRGQKDSSFFNKYWEMWAICRRSFIRRSSWIGSWDHEESVSVGCGQEKMSCHKLG